MWPWKNRIDVVLANETGDTTLAALAMVVRYHARSVTLDQVRDAVTEVGGEVGGEVTAVQMIEAAERFGLRGTGFEVLGPRTIAALRTPNIAHMMRARGNIPRSWQQADAYFAVVSSVSTLVSRVSWIHPELGRKESTIDEFFHYASGVFLVFEKALPLPRAQLNKRT
jgi:ABC-type bacteriocin/lantibiotic exporter with double-glycine peptidase domain